MRWLIASAFTIAAAAALAATRNAGTLSPFTVSDEAEPEAEQGATWWDDVVTTIDPSSYAAPAVSGPVADANVRAGLLTIRYAEGTAGEDGYRTLFGGGLFDGWDDHPRIALRYRDLWTTAAGAYQLMAVSPIPGTDRTTRVNTWDKLRERLQLPDFTPASQDAAAIELIRERGALGDLMAGRFDTFIRKCAPVWASLPGAGYGQPERKLASLAAAFRAAGGITEA